MSIVRILSAVSAGVIAVQASLMAASGDVVPQATLIALAAVSAFLSAVVASLKAE